MPLAAGLVDGHGARIVPADAAWDAGHFREWIVAMGVTAVIPNNLSRTAKHPADWHLYLDRHFVDCCLSGLKQFRRGATRYEKTARNYLAVVTIAATILRLR